MSESGGIQSEETYVVSFDDTRATDCALVGGKSANLTQHVSADISVSAGFCVTIGSNMPHVGSS
jgi:phosphoenolpyruvate synthase/pyruvate phosphate dikinase